MIGFEETEYRVKEGESSSVEVCVKIFEPDVIDPSFIVTAILNTAENSSAEGKTFNTLLVDKN